MTLKQAKIAFWITTGIIFLMEGLLPVLTMNAEMTKAGMMHLGYPAYFGPMLAIFKGLGGLVLILPMVPARVKEWAYVGYGIDFLSAFISICVVDGLGGMVVLPLIFLVLLAISYLSYHQLLAAKKA